MGSEISQKETLRRKQMLVLWRVNEELQRQGCYCQCGRLGKLDLKNYSEWMSVRKVALAWDVR